VCTVCDRDCKAKFTCSFCGFRKNVCLARVGGFDVKKDICVTCFEELVLPPQMVFLMRLKDSEEVKREKLARWQEKGLG